MEQKDSLASVGIVKDGVEPDVPFNKQRGLPNVFGVIAILGAVCVFFAGFIVGGNGPNNMAVGIGFWVEGWVGCLFIYALGAIVAALRQIEHNTARR
ncbi:MAG: hypothetical protein ABIY40_05425 [Rhodanobacteraceae bacterium]